MTQMSTPDDFDRKYGIGQYAPTPEKPQQAIPTQQPIDTSVSGAVKGVGTGLMAGLWGVPGAVGGLYNAVVPGASSDDNSWGNQLRQVSKTKADEWNQGSENLGAVGKAFHGAAEGIASFAPAMLAPETLPFMALGMGKSAQQETHNRNVAQGIVGQNDTDWNALGHGVLEGGMAYAMPKMAGRFARGMSPYLGQAAPETAEAAANAIRSPANSWGKDFGFNLLKEGAANTALMGGQTAAGYGMDKASGVKDMPSFSDSMKESMGTGLAMTALLGPLSAFSHRQGRAAAQHLDAVLSDPGSRFTEKLQAVSSIHDAIAPQVGKEAADKWAQDYSTQLWAEDKQLRQQQALKGLGVPDQPVPALGYDPTVGSAKSAVFDPNALRMPDEQGIPAGDAVRQHLEDQARQSAVDGMVQRNEQLWNDRGNPLRTDTLPGQGTFDWQNAVNLAMPTTVTQAHVIQNLAHAEQMLGRPIVEGSRWHQVWDAARQMAPDWRPIDSRAPNQKDAEGTAAPAAGGAKKQPVANPVMEGLFNKVNAGTEGTRSAETEGAEKAVRARIGTTTDHAEIQAKLEKIIADNTPETGKRVSARKQTLLDTASALLDEHTKLQEAPEVQAPAGALEKQVGTKDLTQPEAAAGNNPAAPPLGAAAQAEPLAQPAPVPEASTLPAGRVGTPTSEANPAGPTYSPEERAVVGKMLGKLTSEQRKVLSQYSQEKLTMGEIGEANGYSRQNAAKHFAKAKAALVKQGMPIEKVDVLFPDESKRVSAGADVKTYSPAEAAAMGLHAPGGDGTDHALDTTHQNAHAEDTQEAPALEAGTSGDDRGAKEEHVDTPDMAAQIDAKRAQERAESGRPVSAEWDALPVEGKQFAAEKWDEFTKDAEQRQSFDQLSDPLKAQFHKLVTAYFGTPEDSHLRSSLDKTIFGHGTEPGRLARDYGVQFSKEYGRAIEGLANRGYDVSAVNPVPAEHAAPVMQAMFDLAKKGYSITSRISRIGVAETDSKGWNASVTKDADGRFSIVLHPDLLKMGAWDIHKNMLHEIGHALDDGSVGMGVSSDARLAPGGDIRRVLEAIYRTGRDGAGVTANLGRLAQKFLGYPLDARYNDAMLKDGQRERELFAQLFAAYHLDPGPLKIYAPSAHDFMEKVDAKLKINDAGAGTSGDKGQHTELHPGGNGESRSGAREAGSQVEGGSRSGESVTHGSERSTRGTSVTDRDYPQFSREHADELIDKLPEPQRDTAHAVNATLKTVRDKWMGAAFLGDLVDYGKKYLPAALQHYEAKKAQGAAFDHANMRTNDFAQQAGRLSKDEYKGMNRMIDAMDKGKKWAYEPQWFAEKAPGKTPIDRGLEAQFQALSPAAQEAVKQHFKLTHDAFHNLKQVMLKNAGDTLAEARATGDAKSVERAEAVYKRETAAISDALKEAPGPYAPQRRDGKYLVVAKSKEFQALQDKIEAPKGGATQADRDRLEALKKDERHYVVDFADTAYNAAKKAVFYQKLPEFAHNKLDDLYFAKEKYMKGNEAPFAQIQKLKEMLKAQKRGDIADDINLADKTRQAAIDSVNELYLQSLGDLSSKHSQSHRAGVAGYDDNRAAATIKYLRATAHLTAMLEHSGEVHSAIEEIRNQAHRGWYTDEQGNRVDLPGTKRERHAVANELLLRHALNMVHVENAWENRFMQFTAGMKVTTSPAFYLQTFTEPFMVMLPQLAHQHGYWKALGHMWKAAFEARDMMPLLQKNDFKPESYTSPNSPAETTRVRDMLTFLHGRGRIDLNKLSEFGDTDSSGVSKVFAKTFGRLNRIASNMEGINRLTSSVTAYRLHYEKALGDMLHSGMGQAEASDAAHKKAVLDTDKLVRVTHGEYDAFATPRYMMSQNWNGIPVRLITQFKKFQVMQMSLTARNIHEAFSGATPEERAIGRAALGYTFAQYGALTGMFGLPAFGIGSALVDWLLKDKEEALDPELHTQEWLAQQCGPEMAKLLTMGVSGLAGVPMHPRIGAGGMGQVVPVDKVDISDRSKVADMALSFMGPFVGMVANDGVGAFQKFMQGDYYKGTEQLMPTALRNAMQTYRLNTEGMTNAGNDILMTPEEMSFFDKQLRLAGFNTTAMELRQMIASDKFGQEDRYKLLQRRMEHKYAAAFRDQAPDKMSEIRDEWMHMQSVQREQGMIPTPLSALMTAPAAQRMRERMTSDGVQFKRNERNWISGMAEATK